MKRTDISESCSCPHCSGSLSESFILHAAAVINARRARESVRNGRPRKPSKCPRCGLKCESASAARSHCRKNRNRLEES